MNLNLIIDALEPWTVFAIVFVLTLIAALILKKWLWARLQVWAQSFPNGWQERLLDDLNQPAKMLILGFTVAFAQNFVPEMVHDHGLITKTLGIYFVVTGILILDRVAKALIGSQAYFANFTAGTRQLTQIIARILIYSIGALIVLDNLGISITPLLASLGVGSVAVALALQDTLSNFFSGIYVLADRPINVGDYIRLDDGNGMEGNVVHIGWRSTRILQLAGNVVVVPNSKIASSRLTNFNLPTPSTYFGVTVGISYDADLEQVEKVAVEVAKEVIKNTPGAVSTHIPAARFGSFDDSSISMTIGLQAQRFVDTYLIKHELIKALHARFKRDGIDIPFPQRVVHMVQDSPQKQ